MHDPLWFSETSLEELFILTAGRRNLQQARSLLQESALGAGRGGSAPALAEAGPGSVPPEHSDVSGQLTS